MKMSELTKDIVNSLTPEQKWNIVCGGIRDEGGSAEFAILLGSRPHECANRARAAARLYREGRVKYIIPTGGVEWELESGEKVIEAYYMKRILREEGVPQDAIIPEDQARTTKENMICSTLPINRKMPSYSDKRVIIVTAQYHMQRSLALAKTFLPRMMEISAYPCLIDSKEAWLADGEHIETLNRAIRFTRDLVIQGIAEDFEINL